MSDNKIYEPNKEYPLDLTVSWDELRELYNKDEYQIDTARYAMLQHLYKPIMYRNRKIGEIKSVSEEDGQFALKSIIDIPSYVFMNMSGKINFRLVRDIDTDKLSITAYSKKETW